MKRIFIVLLCAVLLAACGAKQPSEEMVQTAIAGTEAAAPQPTLEMTATEVPTQVPTSTPLPTATKTAVPTSTPLPVYDPVTISGSGNDVIEIPEWAKKSAFADIEMKGTSNNIIWEVDSNKEEGGLLANAVGYYSARRPLSTLFDPSEDIQWLSIDTNGEWVITFYQFNPAYIEKHPACQEITGSGDDLIYLSECNALKAVITHEGKGNFVIWALKTDGDEDLLTNEIGTFEVKELWSDNIYLLDVNAEGDWSITFEE